MAGLLAHVPALQDRRGLFGQLHDRQRPAVQQQHHRGLAQRQDLAGELVLLAEQVQALAIAEVIVGPGFAAGLLVVAQHHDEGVRAPGRLERLDDQPGVHLRRGEDDLVLVPDAVLGDPHALAIVHLKAGFAADRPDPLQHRDHLARHVRIAADRGVGRMPAQHQDLADPLGIQRQQPALVLEQDR